MDLRYANNGHCDTKRHTKSESLKWARSEVVDLFVELARVLCDAELGQCCKGRRGAGEPFSQVSTTSARCILSQQPFPREDNSRPPELPATKIDFPSMKEIPMSRFRSIAFVLLLHALAFSSLAMAETGAHAGAQKHEAHKGSAEQIWANLARGNKRYISGQSRPHNYAAKRKELVKGQHPMVAVLSCSDSRVPPEILFDQGLGDLFVVRSAGNSADALELGSLEYAVEHLGSTVIVVMGHQSCGAVKAACSGEKMPSRNLEAVVKPVLQSCKTGAKGDGIDAAVHDHVHRAAMSLLAESEILKHAAEEGKLSIIEAYYELDSGRVVRLH